MMSKRIQWIYWITTGWLCLGMLSTGLVQLSRSKAETELMAEIGYPEYVLTLIGAWKILGVVIILLPGKVLMKEWAYAGFFFLMTGAIISHLASGHVFPELFGPMLLLVLTMLSWYFRPAERRLVTNSQVHAHLS